MQLIQVICNLQGVPAFLFPVEDVPHDGGSFFIHDKLVLIIGGTHIAEHGKAVYKFAFSSLYI